tara:strand:- start:1386 stop:2150 length:765 start_codon:yes stop_codon:yes gene_type:complete
MEYAAFSNNINDTNMSLSTTNYINEPVNYNNLTVDSICSNIIPNENNGHDKKLLTIKESIIQMMTDNDDLLSVDEKKEIPESFKEIDTFVDDLQTKIQIFHKLQDDLIKHESHFKKELDTSKKKLKTIDDMVCFIKNLDHELIDNNDSNDIIKSMEHISEKMEGNCELLTAKKKYFETRKEIQKYIYFIRKLNQWNQVNLCALCMTNQVDSYCNPCGHTLCKGCFNNGITGLNNEKKCPFCREVIYKITPLYFL